MTDWDNTNIPIPTDTSVLMQNSSVLPMSSNNYLIPLTKHSPQSEQWRNVDQHKLQSDSNQPLNVGPSSTIESIDSNKSTSWLDRITISHVIGLIVGLFVTTIPMGVIVTLYVLMPASTNATSNAGSATATVSVSLPSQCTSYSTINDVSRLYNYNSGCCPCDSWLSGWYRIVGASGSQLATYPVNPGYCSTSNPAWWNGTLPSAVGETTSGTECTSYSGNLCDPSYSMSSVLATNCSGFYVFYLKPLNCWCCSIYPRYCTV